MKRYRVYCVRCGGYGYVDREPHCEPRCTDARYPSICVSCRSEVLRMFSPELMYDQHVKDNSHENLCRYCNSRSGNKEGRVD